MFKLIRVTAALGCAVILCSGCPGTPSLMTYRSVLLDIHTKRPGDQRQTRVLKLPNGLQVLLVSDPKAKKSAAAMNVDAGAMDDPDAHLGLAHFMEHMLFLGTKKYPVVGEYGKFISQNGGNRNAYTALESTNYHFDIKHSAFREGLDRFAQFFIAPTFDPQFVKREINAVDSEHRKNIPNNMWREMQLRRLIACAGHPYCRFATGNAKTLKGVTREVLTDWYKKHYSANLMNLAVISKHSLDDLEAWARASFSQVPNGHLVRRQFSSKVFRDEALPVMVRVKPVSERKQLALYFQVPSQYQHKYSKINDFISRLVGDEGKGSLHSLMKRENLANSVSAGGSQFQFAGMFGVEFSLTERGARHPELIMKHFFSYIAMLRAQGFKKSTFLEVKRMGELSYVYRDHAEGMGTASRYAALMKDFPAQDLEKHRYLYYRYNPKLFQRTLTYIVPERMRAFYIAPGVTGDRREEHYGISYKVEKLPRALLAGLKSAPLNPRLSYLPPNPLVPQRLVSPAPDTHTAPYRLINDQRGVVWFLQDREVKLPKARIGFTLVTPRINDTPRHALLAALYRMAFKRRHSEFLYPIREAGLRAGINTDQKGVTLDFSGFNAKLPLLIHQVVARLKDIEIEPKTFAALKVWFRRFFISFPYRMAQTQARYHLGHLLDPHAIHFEQFAKLLPEITLDELKQYAKSLYAEYSLEGVVYGALSPEAVQGVAKDIFQTLGGKRLPRSRWVREESVRLDPGQQFAYVRPTRANNNVWVSTHQVGARTFEDVARTKLLSAHLEQPFYTEMRTRRQMGYVVWSWSRMTKTSLWLSLLVQSPRLTALEIETQVRKWLPAYLAGLERLTDSEIETLKTAAVAKLQEKFTTIGAWYRHVHHGAVTLGGVFDYRERTISALQKLTKASLVAFAKRVLGPRSARITVGTAKRGQPPSVVPGTAIQSLYDFAKKAPKRFR